MHETDTTTGPAPPPARGGRPLLGRISATGVGRPLAILALLGTVLGRGIATALPGSRTGIDSWIRITDFTASMLTQLTVILAATSAVLLWLTLLWQRGLPAGYKLLAFAGVSVIVLVALSVQHRLAPDESIVMALSATALCGGSAIVCLRRSPTRAVGLVLSCVTLATLGFVSARALTWLAGSAAESLTPFARTLATSGFVLDVASLTLAAGWLISARASRLGPLMLLVATAAGVLAWGASRGALSEASLWQVLAARALTEMTPHPAPYASEPTRYWIEAFALMLVAALTLAPQRPVVQRLVLAFAILSRASADIPFCALLLLLAALMAPLPVIFADSRVSPKASAPAPEVATTGQK